MSLLLEALPKPKRFRHIPLWQVLYALPKASQDPQPTHFVSVEFDCPIKLTFRAAVIIMQNIRTPLPLLLGSVLCEVTPLLTLVQTSYGKDLINVESILNASSLDAFDSDGVMVFSISRFVSEQLFTSQADSIEGNLIINQLSMLYTHFPISTNGSGQGWGPILVNHSSISYVPCLQN
jgi:hypothetical protein